MQLEKRQKKTQESQNRNREEAPILEQEQTVYVARQGIKSKTKPKFEAVKVQTNIVRVGIPMSGKTHVSLYNINYLRIN